MMNVRPCRWRIAPPGSGLRESWSSARSGRPSESKSRQSDRLRRRASCGYPTGFQYEGGLGHLRRFRAPRSTWRADSSAVASRPSGGHSVTASAGQCFRDPGQSVARACAGYSLSSFEATRERLARRPVDDKARCQQLRLERLRFRVKGDVTSSKPSQVRTSHRRGAVSAMRDAADDLWRPHRPARRPGQDVGTARPSSASARRAH
jgi:hypothetical protein